MGAELPQDIDHELKGLCTVMNRMPGIRTHESCCGHGTDSFCIFFSVEKRDDVIPLCYFVDACHCGCLGWRVFVSTDCLMSHATYTLKGPVGDKAYRDADVIAACICAWLLPAPDGRA